MVFFSLSYIITYKQLVTPTIIHMALSIFSFTQSHTQAVVITHPNSHGALFSFSHYHTQAVGHTHYNSYGPFNTLFHTVSHTSSCYYPLKLTWHAFLFLTLSQTSSWSHPLKLTYCALNFLSPILSPRIECLQSPSRKHQHSKATASRSITSFRQPTHIISLTNAHHSFNQRTKLPRQPLHLASNDMCLSPPFITCTSYQDIGAASSQLKD